MPLEFRWRRRLISIGLYMTTFAVLVVSVLALEWWRGPQFSAFILLVRVAANKLMYFGQMPLLPYVLNDDVRLLWSLVAQSPTAAAWWLSAAGLIVLTPLAIVLPFIQARHIVGGDRHCQRRAGDAAFRACATGGTGGIVQCVVVAGSKAGWLFRMGGSADGRGTGGFCLERGSLPAVVAAGKPAAILRRSVAAGGRWQPISLG